MIIEKYEIKDFMNKQQASLVIYIEKINERESGKFYDYRQGNFDIDELNALLIQYSDDISSVAFKGGENNPELFSLASLAKQYSLKTIWHTHLTAYPLIYKLHFDIIDNSLKG